MKKILMIALIVVLAFSAVACGKSPEQPSESAAPSSVGGSAQIATSAPSPSGASSGGAVSPTTGLPGNTEYRPVQVQIDNESTGRPQFGIQAADIVYEAMIEGADTRLSAIFNDTLPEKVGPVRSSRVYFQMIQNEWDSIYIHDGGPYNASFPKSYIFSDENGGDMKARLDGGKGTPESIFWHKSAEIAYTNVKAAEEKYNYERTQRTPAFIFDANVDYSKYPDVEKVDIPFISKDITHVEYRYDSGSDKFVRYFFGEPFKDAETDEAVTVQNVIVQYASRDELSGEGTATQAPRIEVGMIGSGKAEFFVGGKHMTGTWEKSDRHAATVYKLDDGSDLKLKPGNTWIEIQPDSKNIVTTNKDGSTEPAGGKAE
jgi:hypothetical protein